jgi:hypothetical protein
MALTASSQASRLFKKSFGYGETSTINEWFEELNYRGPEIVLSNQIWSESGLIPSTTPWPSGTVSGASAGVIQYFDKVSMTVVPGVNAGGKSFYLEDLKNSLGYSVADGSYGPKIFTSTNVAIPFGSGNWLVDHSAGLLTFYPGDSGGGLMPAGVNALNPPKISFYKYIGAIGVSASGGGSGTVYAGNGLTSSGSTFSVVVNPDSLEINSNGIRLKDIVTGDRTFQDSVTIGGNLTVNGTVSYINTEQLYVEDNIIMLNATFSGTPTVNAGLEVNRGNQTNSTLLWDESLDLWTAGLSGSTTPIILNSGTGLTKSGATVSLDFTSITGTGLTQNGSVISIDTTGFATTLAGNGLVSNIGAIDVNVDNTSIVIDNDILGLSSTVSNGITFSSSFNVSNGGTINGLTVSNGSNTTGGSTTDTLTVTGTSSFTGLVTLVSVTGSSAYFNSSLQTPNNPTTGDDVINLTYFGASYSQLQQQIDSIDADFITAIEVGAGLTVSSSTSGTASISILETLAGNGLTYSSGVIDIVWGGTSTGLTYINDTFSVAVDGTTIQINGSGELTVVAGSSNPVYDLSISASTTGDSQPTGALLTSTPNSYSRVQVFINGQLQRLGDGITTTDCYFSSDSGVTAKPLNSLSAGDELYWNGLVALFDLSVTDKIDIVYES